MKRPPVPWRSEEDGRPRTHYDNVDKKALTMQLHTRRHAHVHGEHTHPPPGDEGSPGAAVIGLAAASAGRGRPSPTLRLTPFVHEP